MMVERLQRAVQLLEKLPSNVQETMAEQIEQLAATYVPVTTAPRHSHAGIWADLPDDMEDVLDR